MVNYRTQRILPAILAVIVIIVAIAGLVALARFLFTGTTSTSNAPTEVNAAQQHLLNTADGRSVSMTVRGPIVAEEDFRSYRIVVSPASRQFQAFKGYLETVTNQERLSNNTAAYDQFVHALDKANLVAGRQFEGEQNNVLGICATGRVYEFNLLQDNRSVGMFWASTCKGSPGSLKGSAEQLSQLFLNQIPSSSNITSKLAL